MKTLILGGVRSGKSRLAERFALESKHPVIYLATATALDHEMQTRIANHRARRPNDWTLIEEPLRLAQALQQFEHTEHCILVDCLTLWLTNLLTHKQGMLLQQERDALCNIIPQFAGRLILVSNETNMGIIPAGQLSRRFCDTAGLLHQTLAQHCEQVILTVAGLPQYLKGSPT